MDNILQLIQSKAECIALVGMDWPEAAVLMVVALAFSHIVVSIFGGYKG